MLHNVIDRAIQVHGALGVTERHAARRMYREARYARIYDGPDEVHRATVSRLILREYQRGRGWDFGTRGPPMTFDEFIGMQHRVEDGRHVAFVEIEPHHCNTTGNINGGVFLSMADNLSTGAANQAYFEKTGERKFFGVDLHAVMLANQKGGNGARHRHAHPGGPAHHGHTHAGARRGRPAAGRSDDHARADVELRAGARPGGWAINAEVCGTPPARTRHP